MMTRLFRIIWTVYFAASIAVAATQSSSTTHTCAQIAKAISPASAVFYPGSTSYNSDIFHFSPSSTENATCSVDPGTTADVATILEILGTTRTPFAVKGGGHAQNQHFSSTTGVQIAMTRLNQISLDAHSGSVKLGAGVIWDDVYDTLPLQGVNAIGGRVPGIGVAGFTLGGGYSWKTNQYGLAVDNVLTFELVLPNGKITTVTEQSDPDLFFGLKGGFNNFGIVTSFTLKTFPQTDVWGGSINYAQSEFPAVVAAVSNFSLTARDPKAAMIASWSFAQNSTFVSLQLFYDAPTQPGIFDTLLDIPNIGQNLSTRNFSSLIHSSSSDLLTGIRGVYDGLSVAEFSPAMLQAVINETISWGILLGNTTVDLSYSIEPFLPSVFQHSTAASAYPPNRSRAVFPLNINFAWLNPSDDVTVQNAIRQSSGQLRVAADAEGQNVEDAATYGNYAIFDTPLERIYGRNVERLHALKKRIDPHNVMGLTGGFKF